MKKAWQKNEKKDAKSFQAKQTPRSGGLWFIKGDCKNSQFLIDSKLTEKAGYTITEKTWEKLSSEALLSRCLPILCISFGKKKKQEVVVLDKNDFISLIEGGKK
jgi:hypothetical protein